MKGKLRVSLLIEGDRLVSGTMVEVTKDMIDSGYVVKGSVVNAKKDDKSEVKAKAEEKQVISKHNKMIESENTK